MYARTRSQRPETPVSSYIHRVPNNTSGHYKRAVSVALSVTLGDCGGIIAGNVYRLRDHPRYLLGREYISYDLVYYPHYIADCRRSIDGLELLFICIGLILTPIVTLTYWRINKKRELLMREAGEKGIKYTPEELRNLGDRAPDFRYTL